MIQFLDIKGKIIEQSEFKIISGNESLKFFTKRIWYVILSVYSTIFVASIDPFVNSALEIWVFYAGAVLTVFILLRLVNHAIKFSQYSGGGIILSSDNIRIKSAGGETSIPADAIENINVNFMGNLIIRHKGGKESFSVFILTEEDRGKMLSLFEDISPEKTAFYKKIHDFVDAILIAFILAMHIREYIIQAYFIPTGSMEDTLLVGDHLLVEKITFGPVIPRMLGMDKEIHLDFMGLRKVQRGDIIIFKPPNEIIKDYIKRCIAVPGDTVRIKDGSVYVNDKRLDEPYTKGITSFDDFPDKKIEGIVPDGMVVVLGDNRENSYDGRGFGYLPIVRIKGKAFTLYWNTKMIKNMDLSRFGLIR